MKQFGLYVKDELQKEFRNLGAGILNFSFSIHPGDSVGGVKCEYLSWEGVSTGKIFETEIYSGDVVKFVDTLGGRRTSLHFDELKKKKLSEVYSESNMGNPSKFHCHMAVNENEKHLLFAGDSAGLMIQISVFSNTRLPEILIGLYDSNGTEQWNKSIVELIEDVEIVYFPTTD